jgi:hypothetical protein
VHNFVKNKRSALKALSASVDVSGIEAKAFLSCAKDLGLFWFLHRQPPSFNFCSTKTQKTTRINQNVSGFQTLNKVMSHFSAVRLELDSWLMRFFYFFQKGLDLLES